MARIVTFEGFRKHLSSNYASFVASQGFVTNHRAAMRARWQTKNAELDDCPCCGNPIPKTAVMCDACDEPYRPPGAWLSEAFPDDAHENDEKATDEFWAKLKAKQ